MNTEPLLRFQVNAIWNLLGFGARFVIDFNNIDYTKGRGILDGKSRCVWTKKGQRITISVASDGGVVAWQDKEADPELPPSIYPEVNINLFKCIKPECEIVVDRSVRKSGACCKEHMSYECSHPDCVKRAAKEGWSRYTHPYGSKIAKAHYPFRTRACPDTKETS